MVILFYVVSLVVYFVFIYVFFSLVFKKYLIVIENLMDECNRKIINAIF